MFRRLKSAYGAGVRSGICFSVAAKPSLIKYAASTNPCKGLRRIAWSLGFRKGLTSIPTRRY
jgi:hypothetical protein